MVNLVIHDRVTSERVPSGDRIAQLVVRRVERADFLVAPSASPTPGQFPRPGTVERRNAVRPGNPRTRADEESQ